MLKTAVLPHFVNVLPFDEIVVDTTSELPPAHPIRLHQNDIHVI